jgi:peptidoglycan/LPS O-acetylase OafA/YrhL
MNSDTRYRYIDFLRGVAILMVIATHIKGVAPQCSGIMNAVLSFGRMGVQLFFVVSACTLLFSWVRAQKRGPQLPGFWIRRYFRIAPMYYVGIAVYCASAAWKHYIRTGVIQWPEQYALPSFLSNLFLVHSFYPAGNNNVVPGGWSIATEFLFYLIFPALAVLMTSTARKTWSTCFIAYGIVLITIHALLTHRFDFKMELGDFWFHSLLNQLPVFLLGLLAASLLLANQSIKPWILTLSFAIFMLLSLAIWNHRHSIAMSILPTCVGGAFACMTLFFARLNDRTFDGALGPVCTIGKASYSMYLWHFVVIDVLKASLPEVMLSWKDYSALVFYVLTVAITLLAARLSVRHVEAWGIRTGRKLCS